jgi:putative methionine-R-sulfoxide reductase with GAF domain
VRRKGNYDPGQTIDFIKRRIRYLNAVVLVSLFVILLLTARMLYSFMSYLSQEAVVGVLALMAVLIALVYAISHATSTRATRAIESYNENLTSLLTVSTDLHSISYSDILFDTVMDTAMDMTKARGGVLFLTEGDHLAVKIARGPGSEELAGHTLPDTQSVAGHVVEKGEPLRLDDTGREAHLYADADRELEQKAGHAVTSLLCVPLKLGRYTIGALELLSDVPDAFTAEEEYLVSYFANQAAVSIEKILFFEDEKNYETHFTNLLIEAIENVYEKRGHARRIARYTRLMADGARMPEEEKERLYRAALLHDIGFLRIKLHRVASQEEYQAHVQIGHDMLKPITFYGDILDMVLHHHERFDGTGYPSGLAGEDIPVESRMLCIAEAFDAMVSKSSYKNMVSSLDESVKPEIVGFDEAVEELRAHAGTQFDPELVEIFIERVKPGDFE